MSNYNNNNKSAWNSSSNPWNSSSDLSKNIDKSECKSSSNPWNSSSNPSRNIDEHSKQSSLEEGSVIIIGTRPPISCHVSPIGQNIVIPNRNCSSEKRAYHNRKSCGQHDSLYYQPRTAIHNHRQQYCHDRRIQQASYKNYYNRDKGVAHGMIYSGIPTPEKQATPIIPLENDSYSRKKLIHIQLS